MPRTVSRSGPLDGSIPPKLRREDMALAPTRVAAAKNKNVEYYVEKVVDKRINDGVVEYRVKWHNYPMTESTWEPLVHLTSAQEAVKEFEATLGATPKKIPERTRKTIENVKTGRSQDDGVEAVAKVAQGARSRDISATSRSGNANLSSGEGRDHRKNKIPQKRKQPSTAKNHVCSPVESEPAEVRNETQKKVATRRSPSPPAAPLAILYVRPGNNEPEFLTEFADCTRAWLSASQAENLCLPLVYRYLLSYINYSAVNRRNPDFDMP